MNRGARLVALAIALGVVFLAAIVGYLAANGGHIEAPNGDKRNADLPAFCSMEPHTPPRQAFAHDSSLVVAFYAGIASYAPDSTYVDAKAVADALRAQLPGQPFDRPRAEAAARRVEAFGAEHCTPDGRVRR